MEDNLSEFVEVDRPPNNSGAFLPPAQFTGDVQDPSRKPTVKVHRMKLLRLINQYEDGDTVDLCLLWAVLGATRVSDELQHWFRCIRPELYEP